MRWDKPELQKMGLVYKCWDVLDFACIPFMQRNDCSFYYRFKVAGKNYLKVIFHCSQNLEFNTWVFNPFFIPNAWFVLSWGQVLRRLHGINDQLVWVLVYIFVIFHFIQSYIILNIYHRLNVVAMTFQYIVKYFIDLMAIHFWYILDVFI